LNRGEGLKDISLFQILVSANETAVGWVSDVLRVLLYQGTEALLKLENHDIKCESN
jgi:hypothetical protein